MKNLHKKQHDILDFTAGANLTSGTPVVITSGANGVVGIPLADIANGEVGPVAIKNLSVELDAESGTGKTFTAGDQLYWNASTNKLTKTVTGASRIGRAGLNKTASATRGVVVVGWN